MNKFTLLLLLIALLVNSQPANEEVVYSSLQDKIDMSKLVPKDYLETFDEKFGSRNLQKSESPSLSELHSILKNSIVLLMEYGIDFSQKRIHQKNYACGLNIFEKTHQVGVNNYDLHIFVTYTNDCTSYLADVIWCNLDPNPNVGRVNFNLSSMDINESSTQSFQDSFSVALHEIMHILGFIGSSVEYWINPNTGRPYGLEVDQIMKISRNYYGCPSIDGMYIENQGEGGSFGSHWERDLLGNEFMTVSAVYGYYTISTFTAALLLDTGYYAQINTNLLMPIYWGKNKGCDIFNKSCNAGKQFPEFPDNSRDETCDFYSQGISRPQNAYGFSQCKTIHMNSQNFCDSDYLISDGRFRQNQGDGSRCFRSNSNAKGGEFLKVQGRCFKAQCSNGLSSIKVNVWENEYVTCQYPNQVINLADQTKSTQGIMYCICLKGYADIDCSKKCEEGQVWDGTRCAQKCPFGQYKNFDNTCKTTCPYKQYGDQFTDSCAICSNSCSACFGPFSIQFLLCNDGFSLQGNQCLESTCHSSCKTCSGTNANQCTSCPSGKYLDSKQNCKPCQAPCESCFNSATESTTCVEGYEIEKASGQCVLSSVCDISCQGCYIFKDPRGCLTCKDGYFYDGFQGRCSKQIAKGYEYNGYTQRCYQSCHVSCESCTSPYDPKASKSCSYNHVIQNNLCVPCNQSCFGCSGDPQKCIDCKPGYKFDKSQQTCITIYQPDKFLDTNGSYQKCTSPCATCQYFNDFCNSCISECSQFNDPNSFTSCRDGMYLQSGRCIFCIDECQTCETDSSYCTSCRTNCTSCQDGFSKDPKTGICIVNTPICRSNEYLDGNNQCKKCTSPCASCSSQPYLCSSCILGYKFNSQTLQCEQGIITCRDGQFLDQDNQCKSCDSSCDTCDQTSKCQRCSESCSKCENQDNCSECANAYTLDKRAQRNIQNQINQKCHPNCKECSQPNNASACDSCHDGLSILKQQKIIHSLRQKLFDM
ncbi:hypothetical protein ABPG72_018449 [Tetrahymena utriculariae]